MQEAPGELLLRRLGRVALPQRQVERRGEAGAVGTELQCIRNGRGRRAKMRVEGEDLVAASGARARRA